MVSTPFIKVSLAGEAVLVITVLPVIVSAGLQLLVVLNQALLVGRHARGLCDQILDFVHGRS